MKTLNEVLEWAKNTPDELFPDVKTETKEATSIDYTKNIADAVDYGAYLNNQKKQIEAELNTIKDQLKTYAEKNGIKQIEGNEAIAKISGTTKTEIPFIPALKYLKNHGLNIDGVFKTSVTEFKKLVGDTGLAEVNAKIEKIEYNSVSFK